MHHSWPQRFVIFTFALLALGACGGDKAALPDTQNDGPALVGVRVVKPQQQITTKLVQVTGTLRAKHEATLSAPATGTLAKIHIEVGQRVKEGQALVQLDTSNAVIGVDQAAAARSMAEAGLDSAKIELERAKQLRQNDAAPPATLDRATAAFRHAQAALEQASATLRAAQEGLRDHTLRAPFDGIVTQRLKNLGETVAMMPPTPVVSVVAADDLEVRVLVPETVVDFIKQGALAKGKVSPSGKAFEATVTAVGAVVEPTTRTVEVLAKVTSPLFPEMRPGAITELDFSQVVGEQDVAGLFLPAQAVRADGDRRFVFVVENGVVAERDITAEPITPGIVRVRTGLTKEEQVVVEGAQSLRAGLRVRVAS